MGTKRYFPRLGLQMSPASWHNFRMDMTASGIFSLFNVVFNQFYMPIAIQQGASNIQVGLLSAAPAIGLLFSPLWASWIERTSPKRFVVWPNLIGRSLIILPALFGAPLVFVIVALAFQLLMGIQAPAYAALMTRVYPAQLRGRLMGYVRVIMGILMIPIAFFVGFWIDASGPASPLFLASITGVVSIIIFSRMRESEAVPETPIAVKRAKFSEQWKLIKANKTLRIFLIATTCSGFGNILAAPMYQIIQVERLGLTNVEIGFARIAYFTCLLFAYFFVGRAIDRYSPNHVLVYGIGAFAVVPLLYGIFGNYAAVIAGSGIQGIGDAIWDIGILAFVFRVAPGREAVVFGLHLLLFGIRGTIAPLLSTSLSDVFTFSSMLLAASVCGWIGTAIFIFGLRDKKPKLASQ